MRIITALLYTTLAVVCLSGCKVTQTPSQASVLSSPPSTGTASVAEAHVRVGVALSQTPDPAPADPNAIPADQPELAKTLNLAGRNNPDGTTTFDYDTFPFTVVNGQKSVGGYPIYLIECNRQSNTCVGEAGQSIGSIDDVAHRITTIRNHDVIAHGYVCDKLCWDPDRHVVGAPSAAMIAWVQQHPTTHY